MKKGENWKEKVNYLGNGRYNICFSVEYDDGKSTKSGIMAGYETLKDGEALKEALAEEAKRLRYILEV